MILQKTAFIKYKIHTVHKITGDIKFGEAQFSLFLTSLANWRTASGSNKFVIKFHNPLKIIYEGYETQY